MNGNMDFKKQVDTILKFDKEIYRKSGNRPVIYVIWFFMFLFCWFMPFADDLEAYIFVGIISALIHLFVYSGTATGVGENGRVIRVEVCRLYNLNINAYIVSKLIMVARAAVVTAAILAVVAIIEWPVTDWERFFGCIFWIIATYLANAVFVVTNEKIIDIVKVK